MMLLEIIWIVVIVKIAGLKTVGSLQYKGGAAEFLLMIEFLQILGCIYDVAGVNWIVVLVKIAGLKTVGSLQYRGGAVECFF